jgi:hypothetical protein
MAVVRNSALVAWIRGKIGTIVYKTWKNKQVAQAYNAASFLSPASDRMLLVQAIFKVASDAWQDLSETNKALWEEVAKQFSGKGTLNENTGGTRRLVSNNKSKTDGRGFFISCYYNAYVHRQYNPLTWDLLDQPWNNTTGWTTEGAGTVDINPASQLRIIPDASNYAGIFKDIGSLPLTGYTAQFEVYFDDLSTFASGNYFYIQFWDGQHVVEIGISTDEIRCLNSAAVYDTFASVTAQDTWYTYRLLVDSNAPSVTIYRKTDTSVWELVTTFTDIYGNAGNPGTIHVYQNRGGAGASQSHSHYLKVYTGLKSPVISLTNPLVTDKPLPIKDFSAEYAANTLTLSWNDSNNWNDAKHRAGFWLTGGETSAGKIFKQWLGYQEDPTSLTKDYLAVYVAGATYELLGDIEPTFVYVQAYTCDIDTGLISSGTETVKVLIE